MTWPSYRLRSTTRPIIGNILNGNIHSNAIFICGTGEYRGKFIKHRQT